MSIDAEFPNQWVGKQIIVKINKMFEIIENFNICKFSICNKIQFKINTIYKVVN